LEILTILEKKKKKKKKLPSEFLEVKNQREKKMYLRGALDSAQHHCIGGVYYLRGSLDSAQHHRMRGVHYPSM